MRLLTPSLALLLLLVPLDDLWIEPVQASIFSSAPSSEVAPSCGPSYEACPVSSPCCNNGTCHETSLMACSMSLGCEPRYSHPLDDKSSSKKKNKKKSKRGEDNDEEYEDDGDPRSCFPLPVCRSFKETFKHNDADKKGQHKLLVPKLDFVGDPDLAHWTSEFDHIAPNAVVDPKQKRLVLKAKRDTVKTQSGGGFGATISSTRWNLYGSFSAKLKSGATGPGIVTAMMLSNPMRGEEITIEVTGRDPHTVVTDFYSHSARDSHSSKGTGSWLPSLNLKSVVPSMDGLRVRTRKLKAMILPKTQEKKNKEHDQDEDEKEEEVEEDNSLEESHALKRSAVDHDLVYKIEWTPEKIEWSVDGKVIRTLTNAKLLKQRGYGLPSHPMLLQLTIWDGGYNSETEAWAGGRTDYGAKDDKEYATLVEWIDISCHDRKEAKRNPWPGPQAEKRLAEVEKVKKARIAELEAAKKAEEKLKKKEMKQKEKQDVKAEKEKQKQQRKETKKGWFFGRSDKESKQDDKDTSSKKGAADKLQKKEPGLMERFFDAAVQTLLRWMLVLVILTGSASYLTDPVRARGLYNSKEHARMKPYEVE